MAVMLRSLRGRLSPAQRRQVVDLMAAGLSAAEVGRRVGCDYRTVQHWWARWLAEEPLEDRERGGRPRATTAEEDARIVQYAQDHVFCTAGEIKEALGLHCDTTTIRE